MGGVNGLENLSDFLDKKECNMCHELRSIHNFRKIWGSDEYCDVCESCEDKILTAKYLKELLKYLKPGQSFNKDNLIHKYPNENLKEKILTLHEQDIIRKDRGSMYSLKSKEIIENFLNSYYKELPKVNKNLSNNQSLKTNLNNNNESSQKTKTINEFKKVPNMIECNICHEVLPKNNFNKISGSNEYSEVCKKCDDKIIAAKYLKLVLNYLNPGEKFDKEELIKEHPTQDINEAIFTLQEQDLIKNDYESNYYLESEDFINNFLEKYLKELPKIKNFNYALNNVKKINNSLKNNTKPLKTSSEDAGDGFKWVSYNKESYKWNAYVYNDFMEKTCLGDFDSEMDAYQARFKYLQNIPENVSIPEKKSNGQYSLYEHVYFSKLRLRWTSNVKIPNPDKSKRNKTKDLDLGQFASEEEAYQARIGYLNENHELFNDPNRKKNGRVTDYECVNYNYAYHKWYTYILKEKTKHMVMIGYFESEEEAYNAREDYLKGNYKKNVSVTNKKQYVNRKNQNIIPEKKSNGQYSYYDGVTYNIGVHKWNAYIKKNGKNFNLGFFNSEDEAYQARENYLKEHHLSIPSSKKDNTENNIPESINNHIKDFDSVNNNCSVKFFVNSLNNPVEILVKGILSIDDAFNSFIKLKSIRSEINKMIFDNKDNNIELLIEIKLKNHDLKYIVSLLNKLGWEQLNII
jgi:hypothetical protein